MNKSKKHLEAQAQEAVRKASEAVRAANDALNEANVALKVMQELSEADLEQVSGGADDGSSEWEDLPTTQEYDYPIPPKP